MSPASERFALIEKDLSRESAPKGYTWYIVRDWSRVVRGRASAVLLGKDFSPLALPDEVVYDFDRNENITGRLPRYVCEVSHVLLKTSFILPRAIAEMTVKPLRNEPGSQRGVLKSVAPLILNEVTTPEEAAKGFKAYTFFDPTLVFRGVVKSLKGNGTRYFGSAESSAEFNVTRQKTGNEQSRILIRPQNLGPDIPVNKH